METSTLSGDRTRAAVGRAANRLRRGLVVAVAALGGALAALAGQYVLEARPLPAPPAQAADVLATVDGETITIADFEAEMAARGAINYPTFESRDALLTDMVRLKVFAASGRARGYLGEYDTRRDLDQVLAGKYQQQVVEPQLAKLDVNDDEVAAYYQDHARRFLEPAAARAAVIFLAVRLNAPDAVREQIRARAAQVHAEAAREPGALPFGALAIQHSDDQASRYRGGDVGWLAADQADSVWEPAVTEAIFALEQPGDLAPVLETPNGFYVVRLLEKKPEAMRPLEQVAPAIRQLLLREKRRQRSDALYARAARAVSVEIHAGRLPPPDPQLAPLAPPAPPAVPGL